MKTFNEDYKWIYLFLLVFAVIIFSMAFIVLRFIIINGASF